MRRKKTWKEKLLDSKDLPRVEPIPEKMQSRWGSGTLVIPAPLEVDEIMRSVPKGKLITINQIRARLAKKHHATIGCPMTTGIFASIAAHAAEEDARNGVEQITPYWRSLKNGGVLNEKYPGGAEHQKELLEKEGHTVVKRGKHYRVQDFEDFLVEDEAGL